MRHVYVVTASRIVAPTDWSIAGERGRERLSLTTCTPRFSARERHVVFAAVVTTTRPREQVATAGAPLVRDAAAGA